MKNFFQPDAWNIIEEGFHPEYNEFTESCFSIGNGKFGHRACFEEQFSGHSFRGSYVAGIFYQEKTGTNNWKNGYSEYFDKMPNAPDWSGIEILIDGEVLDLATCRVKEFRRVLNMRTGCLERSFVAKLVSGKEIQVNSTRFCSIASKDTGAIRYTVRPLNFSGVITLTPYVDGDVLNKNAGSKEGCWVEIDKSIKKRSGYLVTMTPKTHFHVCTGMRFAVFRNGSEFEGDSTPQQDERYFGCSVRVNARQKDEVAIYKYVCVMSSLDVEKARLLEHCKFVLKRSEKTGFEQLLKDHTQAWEDRWEKADIVIEGDLAAQQAIRFSIFHLLQAYSGEDDRLSISPAGFTGRNFDGCTTWKTDVFCLPFYLAAAGPSIARSLLLFRFRQSSEAIENARKLGFGNSAVLFPAATLSGAECRNEWDITFGSVHRNGAVAKAIHDYVRYSGDKAFLLEGGLEILTGIARFWTQRVQWSEAEQCYVLLGVTGPNEYECNVNNNWYTNLTAVQCLRYAMEAWDWVASTEPETMTEIINRLGFDQSSETAQWSHISEYMFFPKNEKLGIFLQQDGFLQKEIRPAVSLHAEELPIHLHWTWDRVLRSCFVQQPDVLLGLYFYENQFTPEDLRRNFDYYEPLTVHEDPLSHCVHSILAAKTGRKEQAYDCYRRLATLDLNDLSGDAENGLHPESMAGAWLSLMQGLAGMQVEENYLSFNPFLPANWESYAFRLNWRGISFRVRVGKQGVEIINFSDRILPLKMKGKFIEVLSSAEVTA